MKTLGSHNSQFNAAQFCVGGVATTSPYLPPSPMPLNWREHPYIDGHRQFILRRIAEHVVKILPRAPKQATDQLSALYERTMFANAVTKEDYMCCENIFERLEHFLDEKINHHSFQQKATYAIPSVSPTFASPPPMEHLKRNTSANSLDALSSIIAPSSPLSFGHTEYFNAHQFSTHVTFSLPGSQANELNWERNRTPHMTSSLSHQVTSSMPLTVDGIPSIELVESNLTYSGSVLQYESEASFDSNCKSQHYIEAMQSPVTSARKKPSCMHNPSTLDGDSVQKSIYGSNTEFKMFKPCSKVFKLHADMPQQFEQVEYEPKLCINEPSGKRQNCQRLAQDKNAFVAAQPGFLGTSGLMPTSDICGQLNLEYDHIKLMSCYIQSKNDPQASCRGHGPYLKIWHLRKCKYGCECKDLKLLLGHIDCCGSSHCFTCSLALCFLRDQETERLNSRICLEQTSFGKFSHSDVPDIFSTPSKVRKLDSFYSNGVPFSGSRSVKLEVSPEPQQCFGSLLYSNSGYTELNMEIDTPHTQYSGNISESKIDLLEDEQRFCSDNASPMSEECVDYKQNEVEPAISSEAEDKALESLSSPSSKCVTTMSEHPCASQTNNAGFSADSEGTKLDITVEPLESTSAMLKMQGVSEHQCASQTNNAGFSADSEGTKQDTTVEPLESTSATLKMQGVSLTDFFTPEEIKQHMWSLKQNIDQGVAEEEIGSKMNNSISENFCQLCNSDKLWFPPMPIFCSACAGRIKCRGTYYCMLEENGGQSCLCSSCYNKLRGPNKSKMEVKRNDVVTEESWVQCDKCEGWQHQICALFNDKRDFGGKAKYFCPKCHLAELESGECKPLPWTSCFGASNLRRTILSDHLEHRLFERLEKDREDRAKAAGKDLEEVLGSSDLTIRVVSSVDKVLKVKQQFQDIFPDKSYPSEFPYRSKVILLFQKIEGVDVCLFGMYVQEFGSQCSRPNQRCIYISYLDSVKYFRPDTKSVAGEALRTFVYHEILIGYLEYSKKRGFSTCYIWACPPVKGEDYVLYCHPDTQKTPKPDKLRQWYLSMLKKAAKEKIVMNSSNIYEQFFVPNEGCNTKVTAARLPYFDGDYWSSVADSMIKKIEKECGGDLQKKVMKMTRRSLKAMGHTDPTVTEGDAKDILLMHELRQTLASTKEDFIIVYLQFICKHCHEVIASGKRWYCSQCKNFQLCEGCHNEDQNPEDTHISSCGQKHVLSQEVVDGVPTDTEDNDAIMNNCFLENRHALLSFCQGNHYQFDTLRRAKHSSMMILYSLHHPTCAAAGSICSLCLKDVVVDQQWKCNLCPEFIVCAACYQRNGVGCHTHNLTQNLAQTTDPEVETKNASVGLSFAQIKAVLDVLLHASKCTPLETSPCTYPNCLSIKKLFAHTILCKTQVVGGCIYCRKVWIVLRLHSLQCGDWNCGVPRCRDLKTERGMATGYNSRGSAVA